MEREYHKLVRDRIPQIIRSNGEEPVVRILPKDEYKQHLWAKLSEEIDEFRADESIEEFCDVLEVLEALREVLGYSDDRIQEIKSKKRETNGAFREQIFLEKVVKKDEQ